MNLITATAPFTSQVASGWDIHPAGWHNCLGMFRSGRVAVPAGIPGTDSLQKMISIIEDSF